MSRRGAAAVNYGVDQDASSDSELEGASKSTVQRAKSQQPAKRARKANATKKPGSASDKAKATKAARTAHGRSKEVKEIPATQAADESADEFDLPATDERAMSTPMTATKTRSDAVAPIKAASESFAKPKAKPARKAKEIKTEIPDTQFEDVEAEAQASSNFGRTAKASKQPRPAKRDVVPATQVEDAVDVDGGEQQKQLSTGRREQSPKTTGRKRAGSVSDREHSSSSTPAKRRLSDMTKRFEALETRYERLQDVGIKEAKANYDELKQRTDERQKAAENLVSHLRTELAVQSSAAAETKDLKTQVSDLNTLTETLKDENKSLEASLKSTQGEMRALQAKLAATRASSEQRLVPGSAAKTGLNGKQMPGAAGADAQKMAIKEQLYGDLTGLIIRDVKRREDEDGTMDVYDCIQTGKNGTLRFHLAVPNPQPPGVAYGDADIEYSPLLDPSNDRLLIEILPDYLTDEILFPQREAQRFYGRINEFIMKSRSVAQQEPDETELNGDAEGGE